MIRSFLIPVFFICLAASALFSCTGKPAAGDARNLSPGDTASIKFTEYEHDFGRVTQGEKVVCLFTYENKGTIPLVISSASTSCGCTVSKYSTKPLAPGNTATIEVEFDTSGRSGRQSKTVTIRSNATKPVVLIKIKCDVTANSNN